MDRILEEMIDEEVKNIIESYNDETIKTKHNFDVLKKKIAKEKCGVDIK